MSTNPATPIPNRTSSRRPGSVSMDGQKGENNRSTSSRTSTDLSRPQNSHTAPLQRQSYDNQPNRPSTPGSPSSTSSGQIVGSKTRRSMDVAPHDPSPLVPRYSDTSPLKTRSRGESLTNGAGVPVSPTRTRMGQSHGRMGSGQQATNDYGVAADTYTPGLQNGQRTSMDAAGGLSEHVRLPAHFPVGHREFTDVDTTFRPAVTHETIIRKRTEIVQQAITRDVHVHHYHTVVQPIRVVEVLPAKHYLLDEKTGQKTEIAAPAGWVMPDHLQPYVPDTSWIQGLSRHYVVDEEHPNGLMESPPLHHKRDVADLRRSVHNSP